MVELYGGGDPLPPGLKLCQGERCAVFHAGNKTKNRTNQNCFYKTPAAGSPCVPCRAKSRKKSDESQLATFDSVKPKRPPAHAFVGSTVWHFPGTEAHDVAIVFLFIDEKMLCGAKNLVNSLVAVFAAVGHTFKRSKDFSDHIFVGYRLDGSKVHVKGENFAITVRNDSGRLKTFVESHFGDADESGGQTFAGMGVNRDAVASLRFDGQFVFHGDTLAVGDEVGNNFLRLFDTIFVELVQSAPVGLVVHEFVDAPLGVAKGNLEGHDVVDVNFSFDFHGV